MTSIIENAPAQAVSAPDQQEVDAIIRKRVYASMAIGLVPVPLADVAALTAVQTELLYRLAKAHNVPFTEEWGKKAVSVTLGAALPAIFTPTLSDLFRYVPLVGQGLSLASWPITLGASTYALGRAFAKHFASGGTFLDCDLSKVSEEVKAGYEKSKEAVKHFVKREGNKAESEAAVDPV
jgi:uncharacterized protein (DUF697 family)